MSKSSLKKKVLYSLLAASVFGVMYNPGAEAAKVNGQDLNDLKAVEKTEDGAFIITNESFGKTEDGKIDSKKFIFGQGDKIIIATDNNVNTLIADLKAAGKDTDEIRAALAKNAVVGVVGGEGKLDDGLYSMLNLAGSLGSMAGLDKDQIALIKKISELNTVGNENNNVVFDKSTNIVIGSEDASSVVMGIVGGDLSVNTGLNGSININEAQTPITSSSVNITRNGNTNVTVNNGNVLGGVGGSAAVAVGNIYGEFSAEKEIFHQTIKVAVPFELNGETTTTINGDSNLTVNGGANVAGWANGGLAMGIGGKATSIVNGNSNIIIASNVKTDGALDGITAGIAGGGAAITTIGGTALTKVGNVNISVDNGLSAGIIGGGMAAAVDAAGLLGKGNDAGYSDITDEQLEALLGMNGGGVPDGEIIIKGAIEGGNATSKTGDTNLVFTGNTTAAGVMGGGVAVASHTYTNRDTTDDNAENNGTPGGYSTATAETGKAHIVVNLDGEHNTTELVGVASGLKDALSELADGKEMEAIGAIKSALENADGQSSVIGLTGGGMAVAHGDAHSSATTITAGADIDLVDGYAAGVFGGGIAAANSNAQAKAEMKDDININIYKDMEAVGVFGNGLAYFTGSANVAEEKLSGKANVSAVNTNINIAGMADGVVGGGVAIDDSQADKVNAAVRTEGKATINVFDGAEVNKMTLDALDGLAGDPQTDSNKNLDMGNYLAAVKDAAGNVAIAGGGVAIGGGADAYVENAVININGGTVNGDILGGGIAVYGHEGTDGTSIGGSHVKNATINLAGGKVDGSVYAGGAASKHDYRSDEYESAQATVETATINLQGTEVTDIISGAGYYIVSDDQNEKASGEKVFDYSVDSTLNLIGENTLTAVAGASKISGFNTINFTENSETILKPVEDQSGEVAGETVFIDGTMGGVDNKTTIKVADSARLNLSNLADDKLNDYVIAKSYDDVSELWGDDQLAYDRTEGFIVVDETKDGNDNIYKVTYENIEDLTEDELEDAVDSAAYSLGEYGDNVRNIIRGIMKDTDHDDTNEGAHDLITETFENGNQAEVEKCLYTSSMVGEDSGVTSNAISMAQDFADNALLRLSFTQDTVNTDKVGEEGGVWAKYLHNKHEVNGMNSSFGALNSSSDYDGVMVGAELAKKGNMQAGIAFAYGEGDGSGLTTKNDFDMWGISLYGNVKNDDINIIGDLGFSKSSNDITSSVLNNEFNTDRDLNIFTMGVRAEKLYTNGNTQVVPYIGLRYMSVDADSYATTYKSGDAFSYDADRQNIWTLPLGVSLRNETVTDNGWRITPKVDLAYIWAFGDTDNDMTIDSGSGADVLHYDVMDSGSWLASVGIDAGKGDWSYGLSYTLQKGSDAENNKWFVNVNYSF